MISICMNDPQPVITDIQEHLYVRKSEYVLKLFFYYYYCFFFITQKLFLLYFSIAQITHLYDV